jgi:uncharacterized protein (TIGR00369 family)
VSFLPRLEKAKASGDLGWIAEYVPYAQFLGITHAVSDDGGLVARMPFDARLVGNPAVPALHGGGIGSLLEHTAISVILWRLQVQSVPKPITLSVDYLRPGRLEDVYATGRITKHGRRVVNVHVEAWQENRDRLIASAAVHCLVNSAPGG